MSLKTTRLGHHSHQQGNTTFTTIRTAHSSTSSKQKWTTQALSKLRQSPWRSFSPKLGLQFETSSGRWGTLSLLASITELPYSHSWKRALKSGQETTPWRNSPMLGPKVIEQVSSQALKEEQIRTASWPLAPAR